MVSTGTEQWGVQTEQTLPAPRRSIIRGFKSPYSCVFAYWLTLDNRFGNIRNTQEKRTSTSRLIPTPPLLLPFEFRLCNKVASIWSNLGNNKSYHNQPHVGCIHMEFSEALNAEYIEEQYQRWKQDNQSVSRDWQFFFEGFERGITREPRAEIAPDSEQAQGQSSVENLIYRYRDIGHLLACMDPLSACPASHPLLDLSAFDLTSDDLDREFIIPDYTGSEKKTLREILSALKETYCRAVGVEYMHLQDPDERRWLQGRMEPSRNQTDPAPNEKRRILEQLYRAALFEQFLHKKYIGQTRFSLEGAEALIPMMNTLFNHSAAHGCREIILGMAHRGRLNVQVNVLGKSLEQIFGEFEHCYDPESLVGAGDVKYHNGYLADLTRAGGHPLRALLVNNPSHLESVNPVVEGLARARQDMQPEIGTAGILPLLIHGDAAFAGQGVVTETLNMSGLSGYRTGGTIHIVINNQIGYTTVPQDARSTRYATDVAKMLMIPIFHVHGENPETLDHVSRIAADYRREFKKDVVIDLICYRRFGHNEGDEPYFTQPQMYERIRNRQPIHRAYADKLEAEDNVDKQWIESLERSITESLESAYHNVRNEACEFPEDRFFENLNRFTGTFSTDPADTGVKSETLIDLARKLNTMPANVTINPKLLRMFSRRLEAVESGDGIDWGNAETLAFASLLAEGTPIRLSGQDSGRGTFSHRHSVLTDIESGEHYIPLKTIAPDPSLFQVYNSLLAEVGVLGFEYGYSLARPEGLVIWEAQFGDFANNAQSILDLYIASGESKWQRLSGLTLLLPHGWEGMGPEHSSARLERFLQLCAEDNMLVCNATTPAQYFHLLRRQVKSRFRKPLVLMSPKSLLRLPAAVSSLSDLADGGFQEIIDDPSTDKSTRRVIFCSGKIYYQLADQRQQLKKKGVGIVRIEQIHPFPGNRIDSIAAACRGAKQWMWVQEEPENMGAWQFIRPRLEERIGHSLEYVGRKAAASPATGFLTRYKAEQAAVVEQALS